MSLKAIWDYKLNSVIRGVKLEREEGSLFLNKRTVIEIKEFLLKTYGNTNDFHEIVEALDEPTKLERVLA